MRLDTVKVVAYLVWVGTLLVSLAFSVFCFWAIVHFVSKYW